METKSTIQKKKWNTETYANDKINEPLEHNPKIKRVCADKKSVTITNVEVVDEDFITRAVLGEQMKQEKSKSQQFAAAIDKEGLRGFQFDDRKEFTFEGKRYKMEGNKVIEQTKREQWYSKWLQKRLTGRAIAELKQLDEEFIETLKKELNKMDEMTTDEVVEAAINDIRKLINKCSGEFKGYTSKMSQKIK